MKLIHLILACSLWVQITRAEDWFWVDAKINGKPARLVLDTGCEPGLALFRHAAERLNLKLRAGHRRSADQIPYWLTDECTVKLPFCFWGFARGKGQLTVVEIPSYIRQSINMDGAVGWSVVSERVLELDAVKRRFRFIRRVPKEANGWTKLTLRTNMPWGQVLAFEIPDPDSGKGIIFVDTGAAHTGVELSPQKWREWKVAHTNQPTTLIAKYSPQPGIFVREQAWADQLSLGPVNLADVVIEEAAPVNSSGFPEHAATLGLEALKRLDIIVDGKHGFAYLRPKKTPPPAYEHNRLGAVFVHRDEQCDDLVAHVLDGSPASEGGIRNGDVLLKIGEHDVTEWRMWRRLSDLLEQCPGTKLELTLRRGDEPYKTTALLREILAPQTKSSRSSSER